MRRHRQSCFWRSWFKVREARSLDGRPGRYRVSKPAGRIDIPQKSIPFWRRASTCWTDRRRHSSRLPPSSDLIFPSHCFPGCSAFPPPSWPMISGYLRLRISAQGQGCRAGIFVQARAYARGRLRHDAARATPIAPRQGGRNDRIPFCGLNRPTHRSACRACVLPNSGRRPFPTSCVAAGGRYDGAPTRTPSEHSNAGSRRFRIGPPRRPKQKPRSISGSPW